jgi:hypothetical protein
MSTTFTTSAPRVSLEESCLCAQGAPRFCDQFEGLVSLDDVRDELREHAYSDCPCCHGAGVVMGVDVSGDVSMSNDNACVFMGVMGLPVDELCGEVKDLAKAVRGLLRLVNSSKSRSPFVLEASFEEAVPGEMAVVRDGDVVRLERADGRCAVSFGGRSDEYLVLRAKSLLGFLSNAQENGLRVTWS